MQCFYMMVGLPGSGKSTCAQSISNATVHASDAIREELLGSSGDQSNQELVFRTLHERVLSDLKAGKSVVYDATNIRCQDRKNFLNRVKALRNYDLKKVCIFMATPYTRCLENNKKRGAVANSGLRPERSEAGEARLAESQGLEPRREQAERDNAKRERNVPESVIRRMYHHIDPPMYQEGWDDIEVRGDEPQPYGTIPLLLTRLAALNHDNPNHTLSVGNHMMEAFGYYVDHYAKKYARDISIGRAILLHDIGKEHTKVFHDGKGHPTEIAHYYGHERVGAYDSFTYTGDLSTRERIKTAMLIRWHMAPFVVEASDNPDKTEKKFVRLLGKNIWNQVKIINDCDRHAH